MLTALQGWGPLSVKTQNKQVEGTAPTCWAQNHLGPAGAEDAGRSLPEDTLCHVNIRPPVLLPNALAICHR